MPRRMIRSDAKGPYVTYLKRTYRLDSKTKPTHVPVGTLMWFYERSSPSKDTLVGWGPQRDRIVFETTAPKQASAKAAKPGTDEFRTTLGSASVIVRMNDQSKAPLSISVSSRIGITWEKWDEFVEEVNKRREVLPLARITASLESDLQAEDELLAYLKEKGLA